MTAPLTVVEAVSKVMADVQAVAKTGRNQQQNFNFRGIDAVVNAVGPAMRKHGVIAVPETVTPHFEQYATKTGTAMRNTSLTITWRIYGPAGDSIPAQTMGEASDAGDKSVSKAHSVAYRTLLLQALCIPTDEPEPDAVAHERDVYQPPPRYDEAPPLATAGITAAQMRHMHALFGELKISDRAERLTEVDAIIGHPVASSSDLTEAEARLLIDALKKRTKR